MLNADGLGLGLSISQKIVQNSGGNMTVYSEGDGKGSTFKFYMKMSLHHQPVYRVESNSGDSEDCDASIESDLDHSSRGLKQANNIPSGQPMKIVHVRDEAVSQDFAEMVHAYRNSQLKTKQLAGRGAIDI